MARAWVSIGSNIEPEANVRGAVAALQRRFGALTVSTVYRTEAVGFEGQPFLNLVVGFDTDESPVEVFDALRAVEDAQGRTRSGPKFSARTLDLDLLLYDDRRTEVRGRPLPHPDILEYPFVLGPLAELVPDQRHPVDGRRYAELWSAMRDRGEGAEMTAAELDGLAPG
jgi:2-amino-4-hydroxy-6-hydroxymethyldihydropteridine diphosphokinase